jgi:hypothetical protein
MSEHNRIDQTLLESEYAGSFGIVEESLKRFWGISRESALMSIKGNLNQLRQK